MTLGLNAKRSTLNASFGFTLIETLVYIAIIGLVITTFVSYGLSIGATRNKNYSVSIVQSDGRTAMTILSQKIRDAVSVVSPLPGSSADQLVLAMPAPQTNITFSLVNGQLQLIDGSGNTSVITGNNTQISALTFTNLLAGNRQDNIQIDLTIAYRHSSDTAFTYTQRLHTAVSTRQ